MIKPCFEGDGLQRLCRNRNEKFLVEQTASNN